MLDQPGSVRGSAHHVTGGAEGPMQAMEPPPGLGDGQVRVPGESLSQERLRIARLKQLRILDTLPERIFDEITQLAAELCGMPVALVSLVDEHRLWFKSHVGMAGLPEVPRIAASFCGHCILDDSVLEVKDAQRDPRFVHNPFVSGEPHIRYYAGAPIAMPGGERMGTLCVIDRIPRELQPAQLAALRRLASVVSAALLEREQRQDIQSDLQTSEFNRGLLQDGQNDLVCLSSLDGVIRYVNQACVRLFHAGEDSLVGRPFVDAMASADRGEALLWMKGLVAQGSSATMDCRSNLPEGGEVWVAWTHRVVMGVGSAHAAPELVIHSIGKDITQQKQFERSLQQSELRYRRLYEATPAMLHSIDDAGRLVCVTDTWLRKLGYAREEVIGRPSVDFLSPESRRKAIEEVLPSFYKNAFVADVEYEMVRKDGNKIGVLLSATLEKDDDGRPLHSLAIMHDITEKIATARRLRETTEQMQTVLDNVPLRISHWSRDSRNLLANRAFTEWFGTSETKIRGMHVREVLGETWYVKLQPTIDRALAGEHVRLELESISPSGVLQDQDMRFTPHVSEGEIQGIFVVSLDISARRQAERDLAIRDQNIRALLEGVHGYAIYTLDAQGRVSSWNVGAERTKGYSEAEVMGQHFRLFFLPEDVASGKPEAILAMAERDGRCECEDWRRQRDGGKIWAHVLITAIRDTDGRLVGFVKVMRDLTEQRMQQDFLKRVVELAPCAMLMVSEAGEISMANAQASAMFGFSGPELLGRPVEGLLPEHLQLVHRASRETFQSSSGAMPMAGRSDLVGRRRNGEEFPVEIGLSSIYTPNGPATLAAVYDVTVRRAHQAAMERALQEKETLLKEVYHRVKNNLQVVQSLLSLQQRVMPEGVARSALEESVLRIRAMALVHEKLYQTGNLSEVFLPDYVHDLIRQISDSHGLTPMKSVRLTSEIQPLKMGLDSAIPFGLLLTELLSNSIKHGFTEGRVGWIHVALTHSKDGTHLVVRDDGVGLPPGFDPRAISSSMGLQLACSLARQLGGELKASSRGGACFEVSLRA